MAVLPSIAATKTAGKNDACRVCLTLFQAVLPGHVSTFSPMKFLHSLLAVCMATAVLSASAADSLFVQVPAGIDPAAPIPGPVREECGLDMLLGNYALSALGKKGFATQVAASKEQAGSGKYVQLTVLSAHGFGGGSWSGSKSMSIRVDLRQGDTILGSTALSRSSTGGVFGGFKGTCAILDRVATALGNDIARWVSQTVDAAPAGKSSGVSSSEQAPSREQPQE